VLLSDKFKYELFILDPFLSKYNEKIVAINNPFSKPDININTLKKENIILFVGRLNIMQKRIDLLLEIWLKLNKKLSDWQFWVVGDGPERLFMENFCKDNDMINVKFFGKRKPDEFYKRAKILHFTSAYEGFGNVLVEAQSYGCVPILFNSYSSAEDIVTHNENGILITPFDIDEFVDKTLELISNPLKLEEMKFNAFNSIDKFSYDKTYKKWEILLDNITYDREVH